jgi:FkbM family methyltransferase
MDLNRKIFDILNFENGFYVECGANNGYSQSNTIMLERNRNWKGLLIEPSISSFNICKKIRSKRNIFENCVLSSFEDEGKLMSGDFDGDLMSSVGGYRLSRDVNTEIISKTLTTLLKTHNITHVDFFSLDVEGFELNVLKGIDFEYCSPTWIVIEVYTKDLEEIMDFMDKKNYELVGNLTNFNNEEYPNWDGTHNDYLFKLK